MRDPGANEESVSERERNLIDVVAVRKKKIVDHASIKRRSPREFDVEYRGPGFASWLPLAAIRAVNWIKFAEMSSYPEMVREGDWSGIRDSTREEIWEMFEVARRELEGEAPAPGIVEQARVALQRLHEGALGNASFIELEIDKVEATERRAEADNDFQTIANALEALAERVKAEGRK